PCRAHEQPRAYGVFERGNGACHGSRAHLQLTGRPRETCRLGHFYEDAHCLPAVHSGLLPHVDPPCILRGPAPAAMARRAARYSARCTAWARSASCCAGTAQQSSTSSAATAAVGSFV